MIKKIVSAALALCLLFGSAATLPDNYLTDSVSISASAETYECYKYDEYDDHIVITGSIPSSAPVTMNVPPSIKGKPVTQLSLLSGLQGNQITTSVVVPDSVKTIANRAFYRFRALKSVTFKGNVTSFESEVFSGCKSLQKVEIPNGATSIDEGTFNECSSLTSISIPATVTSIGPINAYGVGYDAVYSFIRKSDCETKVPSLVSISVDSNNKNYSSVSGVLYNKDKTELIYCPECVTSVIVPGTIKTIHNENYYSNIKKVPQNGDFYNKSKLKSVVIENGVTLIESRAFEMCNSLSNISIPNSVSELYSSAIMSKELKVVELTNPNIKLGDKSLGYYVSNNGVSTKVSGFTIRGYEGSTAQAYATKNGFNFEPIQGTPSSCQHTYGDPTWTWNGTSSATANFKCTKCGTTQSVNASITSKTTNATCTTAGKTVYTATATYNGKNYTNTKTVTINAKGHKWGSVSYTWTQTSGGYTCTAARVCQNDNSHKETQTVTASYKVTKAPTESSAGEGTYTATFSNSAFKTQTKVVSIPATSHTHSYSSPTWTWNGTSSATAKFACTKCTVTQSVTDSAPKMTASSSATCTNKGSKTYTATVSFGGKSYSNSKTVDVAALGHNWGSPSWNWNGYSTANAVFKCSRCGTTYTVNASITSSTTPATCTADGKTVYTAKASFNGQTYTNSKTQTLTKKGHKWGSPSYSWEKTASGYSCTGVRICANDSSHKQSENAKVSYSVIKQPTQNEEGSGKYTATFTNSVFTTQTKVVPIPAKSHTHSYSTPTWKWVGTSSATAAFKCTGCDNTIFVKGTLTSKTTPATCTTAGKTVYTAKAQYNGKTYTDTKTVTIAAKGHKWGSVTYTWSNDNKTCTATRVCQNVNTHKESQTVNTVYKVTKPATQTAEGTATYTATFSNSAFKQQVKTVTIPVVSHTHTYGNPTWTWNGTSSATANFKCTKCSTVKTVNATITNKKTAATCTTAGKTVYTASAKFNGKTHTNTKTVTVKALGHKFSAWTTTSFNVDKGTSTQTRKCSRCGKIESKTVSNAVTRFAGANRYDTAAMLSKSSYNTSDTVIIADAMTFQDALIAVPLASAYNAPLLLANPNTITSQTEAELKRLKAKKVIIVNTANALKSNTINALKKYNPTIISGKNCFETSKKVAEALQAKIKTNTKNKTTAPTDMFFTTNKAFADALSVSPVAALKGAPILYVDPSKKTLDSNITAYLNKVKGSVKNVYIVGGTTAIPKALENCIKSVLPKKNYKRFDGATRYETCVMINQYFSGVLSSKTVCVAKGLDFPDALAGGVFAAKQKAPLILADNALKDAQKNYLKKKAIDKLYIFGGTVAVPDKLAKEIAKASV